MFNNTGFNPEIWQSLQEDFAEGHE